MKSKKVYRRRISKVVAFREYKRRRISDGIEAVVGGITSAAKGMISLYYDVGGYVKSYMDEDL